MSQHKKIEAVTRFSPDQATDAEIRQDSESTAQLLRKALFSELYLYGLFSSFNDARLYQMGFAEMSWRTRFNNIMEHCATVSVVADILCQVFELQPEQSTYITRVAALHDLAKYREIELRRSIARERARSSLANPSISPNITAADVAEINDATTIFYQTLRLDQETVALIDSVIPEGIEGPQTIDKVIVWLADAMVSGSGVVSIHERMQAASYLDEAVSDAWINEFRDPVFSSDDHFQEATQYHQRLEDAIQLNARRAMAQIMHKQLYRDRYTGKSLHEVQLQIADKLLTQLAQKLRTSSLTALTNLDLPAFRMAAPLARFRVLRKVWVGLGGARDPLVEQIPAVIEDLYQQRLEQFDFETLLRTSYDDAMAQASRHPEHGFENYTSFYNLCEFLYIRLCPQETHEAAKDYPGGAWWMYIDGLDQKGLALEARLQIIVDDILGFYQAKTE